jgi:transposase
MPLTDAPWAVLQPLVERCRPRAKVPPSNLRRTVSAILWRHENGAKWRSMPAELGPWWMAAQTFIRWSRLGVWERLLALTQERGVQLGMTFLDGTSVRAHQKAAGAGPKGAPLRRDEARVRRLAVPVAALAPRLA